jgi:predicted nuclease of predicted toxin-antitoxin system
MKLVLDMNIPPAWAESFVSLGIDAVHWSSVGHARASDTEIMAWASTAGRVVVTHDLDFGAILAASQALGPSVVQIRFDNLLQDDAVARVFAAMTQVGADLASGALVTIDVSRTRIRILPLQR